MQTNRKLGDFVGRWTLEREVTHANAPDATFVGTALWAPEGDDLVYREGGVLSIAGHAEMKTERRYLWRAPLEVFFEDGRFFHSVPPAGGESHHYCAPDDYRVTYRFETWPCFETVWHVKGPRKDYMMFSRYVPQKAE